MFASIKRYAMRDIKFKDMAQQTAVEWLVEQLIPKAMVTYDTTTYNAIQKAKAMEKEQIVNAHLFGLLRPLEMEATKQAEQYYNETYNK